MPNTPTQGIFESNEDYASRVEVYANETAIETSTGQPPSQGFLESSEEYGRRIREEARKEVIESSTGRPPSQGFLESSHDYRERLGVHAHEAIIAKATGQPPTRGWLESETQYRGRVGREADVATIERATGMPPKQGWFETDRDFRQRANVAANEHRAAGRPGESATGALSSVPSSADVSPSIGGSLPGVGVPGILKVPLTIGGVLCFLYLVGRVFGGGGPEHRAEPRTAIVPSPSPALPVRAPAASVDSACGHLGMEPATINSQEWALYRCRTMLDAGSLWRHCLSRSEYSPDKRAGCPGQERCCPPPPSQDQPRATTAGDDHPAGLGAWKGTFEDGQRAKLFLEGPRDGVLMGSVTFVTRAGRFRSIDLRGASSPTDVSLTGTDEKVELLLRPSGSDPDTLIGSLREGSAPPRLMRAERIR
jgi:hypothetical protein